MLMEDLWGVRGWVRVMVRSQVGRARVEKVRVKSRQ